MSTHNIGFYEDLTKIIFESSSNKHLISSIIQQQKNQHSGNTLTIANTFYYSSQRLWYLSGQI